MKTEEVINIQVQLKYTGNEAGQFNYPQVLQTVNGIVKKDEHQTAILFDLYYPGLEKKLRVIHNLRGHQLDLDHFISMSRLIEIAKDDFLFKGSYTWFQPQGGFESWDMAIRIKGCLDKKQIHFIGHPRALIISPKK